MSHVSLSDQIKLIENSRISRVKTTIFYQTILSTGLGRNVNPSAEKLHSRACCLSLTVSWTQPAVLPLFNLLFPIYFLHLCSNQTVVSLWIWKGKIKSRPNSIVTSDSCPRKQNVFLNWALTLDSHASCTTCSVLVVVDSSYKKHNIFIFKTVFINKGSMTAGPEVFLS